MPYITSRPRIDGEVLYYITYITWYEVRDIGEREQQRPKRELGL